jgi:hypothetical protein
MDLFTIYWQPINLSQVNANCPFIDTANATQEAPTAIWPNGYDWIEQELSAADAFTANNQANLHVLIDIKPGTHPPGSPTGR